MLKGLLSICVSLLTVIGYSQISQADTPNLSEHLPEDPQNIITDLSHSTRENGRIALTWKLSGEAPEFFAIERSDNGKNYEVISVLNHLPVQPGYQWIDDAPKKGKSFYRIRYAMKESQPIYSKTISCVIDGYLAFKFYPNPVDHILIIRSEVPLDVVITDANGKIRISQPRVSGLQTLNVSSLEKGIYLIRFSNKLTNTISQEKLMKN